MQRQRYRRNAVGVAPSTQPADAPGSRAARSCCSLRYRARLRSSSRLRCASYRGSRSSRSDVSAAAPARSSSGWVITEGPSGLRTIRASVLLASASVSNSTSRRRRTYSPAMDSASACSWTVCGSSSATTCSTNCWTSSASSFEGPGRDGDRHPAAEPVLDRVLPRHRLAGRCPRAGRGSGVTPVGLEPCSGRHGGSSCRTKPKSGSTRRLCPPASRVRRRSVCLRESLVYATADIVPKQEYTWRRR